MDKNKICFIIYDNHEYSDNLAYIEQLNVPQDMQIECFTISDVDNKYLGYNEVMQISDAKYKVYLDATTYIVNKDFIKDVMCIFNSDSRIGMIGVVGTRNVFESNEKRTYGKIIIDSLINGVSEETFETTGTNTYIEVDDIAESIMITAYDQQWNEKVAQCDSNENHSNEMKKMGYKIVVAEQQLPWCIQEMG